MKRLSSVPPRLAAPSSSLSSLATSGSGFARQDGRTSTQRGYGEDWRRVRAHVLAAEPMCRICKVSPAKEVDHLERFHGIADPLRLATSNLRPLCVPCHRSRTARQSHQGRGGG